MNEGLIILIAFLICICIHVRWKINLGVLATACALIIGCYLFGLAPGRIYSYIPVKILMSLVPITMFYGFAMENGTLAILVNKALSLTGKHTWLIPIGIFTLCYLLGIAGLSCAAIVAIVAPLAIPLAEAAGCNLLLCAAAIAYGPVGGSNFPTSAGGVAARSIVESTSDFGDESIAIAMNWFFDNSLVCILIFAAAYVLLKGYRTTGKVLKIDPTEKMNRTQKINAIFPTILHYAANGSAVHTFFSRIDLALAMSIGIILCCILKLGSFQSVITHHIPWNTIITVCGCSMLIGLGAEVGIIDRLSQAISTNVPAVVIAPVLAIVAGIMSCFSSTIGVVVPTLYPMVPGIAAATGISAAHMYSAIFMGASATGFSPFSVGGALVQSTVKDMEKREALTVPMIILVVIALLTTAVFYLVDLT